MPASYTHHLVAREAYQVLSPSIQDTAQVSFPLYFFGAQGPDFYFFYPALQRKRKNLGAFLHREGGFTAFQVLKSLSAHDPLLLAYALGYITHYAADSVFHPYIYATAGTSALRHARLESMLDIRFKRQFPSKAFTEFFHRKLSREERDELLLLYTAIALRCGISPPKKTAFSQAISLFNAYPPMPNAIFDGYSAQVKMYAANEEHRLWSYPANERIISRESADELFEKSISRAVTLMESFFQATTTKTPLSQEIFGKGFLTGI